MPISEINTKLMLIPDGSALDFDFDTRSESEQRIDRAKGKKEDGIWKRFFDFIKSMRDFFKKGGAFFRKIIRFFRKLRLPKKKKKPKSKTVQKIKKVLKDTFEKGKRAAARLFNFLRDKFKSLFKFLNDKIFKRVANIFRKVIKGKTFGTIKRALGKISGILKKTGRGAGKIGGKLFIAIDLILTGVDTYTELRDRKEELLPQIEEIEDLLSNSNDNLKLADDEYVKIVDKSGDLIRKFEITKKEFDFFTDRMSTRGKGIFVFIEFLKNFIEFWVQLVEVVLTGLSLLLQEALRVFNLSLGSVGGPAGTGSSSSGGSA